MTAASPLRSNRPNPTLRTRRARLGLVLVGALLLGACGVEPGERTQASSDAPRTDADIVGSDVGDTTTTAPTTTTTPPPPDLDVQGMVDSEANAAAANAIADLESWWETAYPDAYGEPYAPLQGGLYAIDSTTDPSEVPCSTPSIDEMLDNAFYCPNEDAVVWDQERFMPQLADTYGTFTVAIVIAHEWGHVVQERAQFGASSVVTQLQADCFAGAWVEHVSEGDETRFGITTDDLDQGLAGVLSLRDAPGGSADDPFAHGSGFDRVGAFQDGFESGVTRCAEYANGDPKPFQFPFEPGSLDEMREGDLPLSGPAGDEGIVELAFPSLAAYWTDTFPDLAGGDDWSPLAEPVVFSADEPPDCGGETVDGYVLFVCIPDRFVGFQSTGAIPDLYEQNGDFAVATLFATQYGLDVVEQLGSAPDEVSATLQGDCLAGSWASALLPPSPPDAYQLVLSPGDLDEAVAVLLTFRSDADRDRQGPGFERVRAFRRGVLRGAESCADIGN